MSDKLNYTEQKIINYLKRWHSGRNRATTFKSLSVALAIPTRELRDIVAHLVSEHKCLIGSISSKGYFWIQDQSDYKHARAEILSRIRKLKTRLDGLDLGWAEEKNGQFNLFDEEVM